MAVIIYTNWLEMVSNVLPMEDSCFASKNDTKIRKCKQTYTTFIDIFGAIGVLIASATKSFCLPLSIRLHHGDQEIDTWFGKKVVFMSYRCSHKESEQQSISVMFCFRSIFSYHSLVENIEYLSEDYSDKPYTIIRVENIKLMILPTNEIDTQMISHPKHSAYLVK